jgi:hypothetical protein
MVENKGHRCDYPVVVGKTVFSQTPFRNLLMSETKWPNRVSASEVVQNYAGSLIESILDIVCSEDDRLIKDIGALIADKGCSSVGAVLDMAGISGKRKELLLRIRGSYQIISVKLKIKNKSPSRNHLSATINHHPSSSCRLITTEKKKKTTTGIYSVVNILKSFYLNPLV